MFGFLLLAVLVGYCSALPTGAPFVLDLTGGAAKPGQVIGRVDNFGPLQIQQQLPPQDPPPSNIAVDPVPDTQVVQTIPEIVRVDPPPSDAGVNTAPDSPVVQTYPEIVRMDSPASNIVLDPVPDSPVVQTYPEIVRVDPPPSNMVVPDSQVVQTIPEIVRVDPPPSNAGVNTVPDSPVVQTYPEIVRVDPPSSNMVVPDSPVVQTYPEIVRVDPPPSNMVVPDSPVVQTYPEIRRVDPPPSNTVVDPVPDSPVVQTLPGIVRMDPPPTNAVVDPVPDSPVVQTIPEIVRIDPPPSNIAVDNVPNNQVYQPIPNNQVDQGRNNIAVGSVGTSSHRGRIDSGGLLPRSSPPNAIDWSCKDYRAHPTNTNMYQVFFNGQWADYSCFGILIWNQTLCSCLVPEDTSEVDPNCPNNRAHKTDPTMYHIKHWGVWLTEPKVCPPHQLWNQTGCRCDWDPLGPRAVVDTPVGGICDLMFNASFTSGLRDDANFNSIGRDPWFHVRVENGTARLDQGRMPVWALSNNDFQRDFQVQLKFRLDDIPQNRNTFTTLVSNACGYDDPTVSVSYRPSDQRFRVFFKDQHVNSTTECTAPTKTPFAFQGISLEYQTSRLCLKVDGVVCIDSNKFGGKIPLTQCPFYFGGDGQTRYMTGNMDDVIVRRFCVVPV